MRIFKSKTLYGSLIVIIIWQVMHLGIDSSIVPGPYETVLTLAGLVVRNLPIHVLSSLYRITLAIGIAIIIGVPLGLVTGSNKWADALVSPIAYILYPVPKIAFLPVFMILFGLGDSSKIILIITIIIFQIILATRDGVREIPAELFCSVKSLGLNRFQTYMHLVIPAVLPKIISAVRTSIGISIAALFFGENFATTYGIGYFIMNCWIMANYTEMFAGILALSLMGIVLFTGLDLLERKLCSWVFVHEHTYNM